MVFSSANSLVEDSAFLPHLGSNEGLLAAQHSLLTSDESCNID